MKVALVRLKYTGHGGAERYVSRLAAELAGRGHEVHLLARSWESRDKAPFIFRPIQSPGGPAFLRQPAFARAVARFLQNENFDLVHSFDRTHSQDVYRAGDGCHVEYLARRARVEGRGRGFIDRINPRHRSFLNLERRLFADPRLKVVLANSKQGKDEIHRHYRLAESMVRVVYNGVDKNRFHPGLATEHRTEVRRELGIGLDEPLVLFMGSGFRRKGAFDLVRALPRIEGRLLVVGKGDAKRLMALAQKTGVLDRVVAPGPKPHPERYYGAADVFVLPSYYEPFSNACLEAMASGLPIVTTNETGAAEAVDPGKNGYTVNIPVAPEELADRIGRAFALNKAEVIATNQKVLEPFDWALNVRQTLAAYEEIVGGKERRLG